MKSIDKFKVQRLAKSSPVALMLDSPKNGQALEGASLNITGWAYAPEDAPLRIAVQRRESVFLTERTISRSDVYNHLARSGEKLKSGTPHGFKFEFLGGDEITIGAEWNGEISWIFKISETRHIEFEEFETFQKLLRAPEGTWRNIYFHNSEDWSAVIIMFNGALTPQKVELQRTVFQRWSWAKHFKHPVISIVDPLTLGDKSLVLGWYLGVEGSNALPEILRPIISEIRNISPNARIIGLGSSGGGFAAIGGTLLGYLDEAIAMNPQTDIMLFEVESAVAAFSDARKYTKCDSDLKAYDFSRLKKGSMITYLQNLRDVHHADIHYKPFRAIAEKSDYSHHFRFIEYEDNFAGHAPPNMSEINRLMGKRFVDLIK